MGKVLQMTPEQADKRLAKIGANLRVKDFTEVVNVIHQDGTSFLFTHATSEMTDEWLLVWTEHTGYHRFFREDLKHMKTWSSARGV